MANYNYDEAGNMAIYFVLSVLGIVLIPMTLSTVAAAVASAYFVSVHASLTDHVKEHPEEQSRGCQCKQCLERRKQVLAKVKGTLLKPKVTKRRVQFVCMSEPTHSDSGFNRTLAILIGWIIVGFLAYTVADVENENKIYNPFKILGISAV